MSQIGRIGGQVLTNNLLRAGVDLAFETDLLYLDVTNRKIGIKDGTPSYELDINNSLKTTNLIVDNQAAISNLRINAPTTISTSVGGIDVYIGGSELFHDRMISRTSSTDYLLFDGNRISSFNNSNIVFDPNGSGQVLIGATTNVTGDVAVSGNITMDGNLSSAGTVTVGDQTLDTVTVNTDFTQSIIPGDDLTYALGADAGDSSPRRWSELHAPDWTPIINWIPENVIISEQLKLDGVNTQIIALQSNEDVNLNPLTAILSSTLDNPNAYSTSANDRFGNVVAVSGNYAIVGAYLEDDASGTSSGKAYIYDVTTGTLLYTLDNPNPYGTSVGDAFGSAVAISGNYAIVGAPTEDAASYGNSGKAYIYDVLTGTLLFTLNPTAPSGNHNFASAVAIDGNYAIIGSWQASTQSGRAYIFDVTTGTLLFTLNNPNPYSGAANDKFGWSVAISGNYAIVGTPSEDEAAGGDSGKAYIYNVTTGTLLFTLNNPNAYDTAAGDHFGTAVAVSGNYAIVTATEEDASGTDSGKAYIYNVTTGTLLNTLDNPNPYSTSTNDNFGGAYLVNRAVDISGNYAVIGAYTEDDAGGTDSGKVYIFDITTGSLKYTIDNPNAYSTSKDDLFGRSVSISGNYIIVGADAEDDAGGTGSGKAYIFKINDGAIKIEQTKWENNDITNLLNTAITFTSTGIGYTRVIGNNGMVVPSGTDAQRRGSPEIGETRWNTDQQYLECFDGTVWQVSIGSGPTVTSGDMDDLSNIYTLILG